MKIEFNLNRLNPSSASQPVAKSGKTAPAQDSASLDKAAALKSAINDVPLVRPEKVDAARAAVSDAKFPPDEVLKAVASLIAQKIK